VTFAIPPLPATDLLVHLDEQQIASFNQQGFTSVPRITTDEELEWIRVVYDELFERRQGGFPGGYFDLARPYDSAGEDRLPQALFPELAIPQLLDTVYVRNARRLGAQLLDAESHEVEMWGHMIDKPPRNGHETPWHQDEAYWEATLTYHAVGVWMPLDDVDEENGCMMFVPGSHRSDVLEHRHISDDPAVHGLRFAAPVDTSAAVAVPLAAGGATFHHRRTFHATGPNTSERRRRAYANEVQTSPVPAAQPAPRPWVDEGREAMARRNIGRS
jgi:ectoine hydroxylase-related dioxygenase (phytanoyl-CoA dioxygenase family)